ncbi:MAG: hypothetical protein GY697_00495 [Desulfobacterales bacterium]|nr:hypothetical protein [Desulfobacterales bacterium]
MKTIGILICVLGSLAAIVYPPYTLAGLGGVKWGFIFGDIVAMFGKSIKVYEHLDFKTLLIELAVINALGLGMVVGAGFKK